MRFTCKKCGEEKAVGLERNYVPGLCDDCRPTYGIYWKAMDDTYFRFAFKTRDIEEARKHLIDDIVVVLLNPKKKYKIGEPLVCEGEKVQHYQEKKETKVGLMVDKSKATKTLSNDYLPSRNYWSKPEPPQDRVVIEGVTLEEKFGLN